MRRLAFARPAPARASALARSHRAAWLSHKCTRKRMRAGSLSSRLPHRDAILQVTAGLPHSGPRK